MNLIEARKLAHDGWVRSPTRTSNSWIRFGGKGSYLERETLSDAARRTDIGADLDAEDWEPKQELFEGELWISRGGVVISEPPLILPYSWRKIRVREVAE